MIAAGRYAKGHLSPAEREVKAICGRVPAALEHASFLKLVRAPLPADLPQRVRLQHQIYDQGWASSCWGFGYYKQLVEMRALAQGWEDVAPVSAGAGYKLAREYMLADGSDDALPDTGSDPSAGVAAMARFGIVAESACPYSDQAPELGRRLNLMQVERGMVYRTLDLGWINAGGTERITAICRALAAGYPVAFGMNVYDAYEGLAPNAVYMGASGQSLGGHAQCIAGYEVTGDSRVTLEIAGSWGTQFATGGDAFMDQDAMTDPDNTFDFVMARIVPRLR